MAALGAASRPRPRAPAAQDGFALDSDTGREETVSQNADSDKGIDFSKMCDSNQEYYLKLEELKNAHLETMAKLESMYRNKLYLKGVQPSKKKNAASPTSCRPTWKKSSYEPLNLHKSFSDSDLSDALGSSISDGSDRELAFEENGSETGSSAFAKERIEKMWDGFSVEDYISRAEHRVPSSPAFRTIRRKQKAWSPKVTVPKPFQMTIREARKREQNIKSKSQVEMENHLLKKQLEEEAECQKQFRANPVPAAVFLPLYHEIVQRNEERRRSFHLRTPSIPSNKGKILQDIQEDEEKRKETRWPYASPRREPRMRNSSANSHLSGLGETKSPKITESTRQRLQVIRNSLEEKRKLEEQQKRNRTKQKQRMKKLQKIVTARAEANDPHQSLAQVSKSKLKTFRNDEKQRMREYLQELQEMEERVKQMPLLLERVTQKNARIAAEKHYSSRLRALGICPEFVSKKGQTTKLLQRSSAEAFNSSIDARERVMRDKVKERESFEEAADGAWSEPSWDEEEGEKRKGIRTSPQDGQSSEEEEEEEEAIAGEVGSSPSSDQHSDEEEDEEEAKAGLSLGHSQEEEDGDHQSRPSSRSDQSPEREEEGQSDTEAEGAVRYEDEEHEDEDDESEEKPSDDEAG